MATTKPAVVDAVDHDEPTSSLAQATRGALAVLPVDQIHPHPKNIRHHAVADDELVESIRAVGLLQPLVVAPLHDGSAEVKYRLITGHRRLDGIKKAGGDHATVVIRRDLTDEGDQVAAMLVENGRRQNLTPIEEAEGYGQLRFDFGWKPGAIAKNSGLTVETVNKRLKLLKLDDKVQDKVDQGQLNIEDALAITELPAADQKKLAQSAGSPNFKWDLGRVRDRIKKQAAADKLAAKYTGEGIPHHKMPANASGTWALNHADHGMTTLAQTFSREPTDHTGCLAFVVAKDSFDKVDVITLVCTDVPSHDEQLDEERRAQRLADEKEQREHEEHERAETLARQLRLDAIMGATERSKIDPALVALIQAILPRLVAGLADRQQQYYSDLLNIPWADRWGDREYTRKKGDVEKFRAHLDPILTGKPQKLLRAFVATLAAGQEYWALDRLSYRSQSTHPWERLTVDDALSWLHLAERSGHDLTPVDHDLRALARGEEPT